MIYRTVGNLPPTRYGNGINSILEDFQEIQGTQNPSTNPRTAGSSSLQITVQASHVCAVILLPPSPLRMLSVPSCQGTNYMAVDLFASASPPGDSQVSIWQLHDLFASVSSSECVASKLAVSLSIARGYRLRRLLYLAPCTLQLIAYMYLMSNISHLVPYILYLIPYTLYLLCILCLIAFTLYLISAT